MTFLLCKERVKIKCWVVLGVVLVLVGTGWMKRLRTGYLCSERGKDSSCGESKAG